MEIIVEIFLEVFLQFVLEILAEVGMHTLGFHNKPHPAIAAIGYLLFGAVLGGLSLLFFDQSFISDPGLKLLYLFAAPVVLGLVMSLIGKVRVSRDKDVIRLEKFAFGFLFAFGLAVVRYLWAG